ncbi:MAG: transglycosylase domain-containing protein [Lentisphaeria bacterium]|nr:transglycosylase domain-containing protein [Lentisphaeria bacterium]
MKLSARRFLILTVAAGIIILAAAAGTLWYFAPQWLADPTGHLTKQTPLRVYYDRYGKEAYLERTYDVQWRFHTPLSAVPPHVIQVILAAEDRNFYEHSGVDYASIFRAMIQNLKHFRIVSGASTVTMQLAGMTFPKRERSLKRKIHQALIARKLEQIWTKDRILEEYLNRIPFGGKIYGIEAAARYYFGITAEKLTIAETALLCGLPQRPNAYRPDRHYDLARDRQKRVLIMLARQGIIRENQVNSMFAERPRLRDFRYKSDMERLGQCGEAIFYFRQAARQGKYQYNIHTAWDPDISAALHQILKNATGKTGGPPHGAGVIINNRTGEVIAMAGTVDFHSPSGGQVNAAMSFRTAGSVLKPFLYQEAINAGLICSDTILQDTPIRFRDYTPENADGEFRGTVNVRDALTRSLNTPAVRLTAQLTPYRVAAAFAKHGLMQKNLTRQQAKKAGLSLTLGTAGHTLYSITKAYTVFTGPQCRGSFLKVDMHANAPERFPTPADAMIAQILSTLPLPGAPCLTAGWKTGTSSGCRDAWCAAFTPEYTIGVWMGNKNGSCIYGMTGSDHAAPVAGAILQELYKHGGAPAPMPHTGDQRCFEFSTLCSVTGLTASALCSKRYSGVVAKGIPLRRCRSCSGAQRKEYIRILSPKAGEYIADADNVVKLRIQTETPNTVWFCNGEYWGECEDGERKTLTPGKYTITAMSATDEKLSPGRVEILVKAQNVK